MYLSSIDLLIVAYSWLFRARCTVHSTLYMYRTQQPLKIEHAMDKVQIGTAYATVTVQSY